MHYLLAHHTNRFLSFSILVILCGFMIVPTLNAQTFNYYSIPCSIVNEGATHQMDYTTIENYKTAVKALSDKIAATTPVADIEEKKIQYISLEQELDTLDDTIDDYEHTIKVAYKNGNLTTEAYKSFKTQIGKLKNQIDLAEDILELKFGIED